MNKTHILEEIKGDLEDLFSEVDFMENSDSREFNVDDCVKDIKAKLQYMINKILNYKRVPINYYINHTKDCGTKYRGCSPDCPKDNWEEKGIWIGK